MRDKVGVIDGTLHCGAACDWGAGGAGAGTTVAGVGTTVTGADTTVAGADTTVAGGAGAGSWN